MINLKSLMMVSVAVISLTSFANASEIGYLGSRDDIIVNNNADAPEAEEMMDMQESDNTVDSVVNSKIETMKETSTQPVQSKAVQPAMAQPTPVQESAVVPEKMETRTVSTPDGRMKTITMKTPVVTEKTSSTMTSGDMAATSRTMPAAPTGMSGDVPPNAKPGECYAKVLIPAITETKTDRIQVSEEQKVLDRIVPAQYETQTERVMVKDARTYWKAGKGPISKVNEVTGEILCLVEEPAEYKNIEKRVLIAPERPEYKMVPAKFENVSKTNIITAESWEWRRILCETNLSTEAITSIQRALNTKGYNLNIDGRLGESTMTAINNYQTKNSLASRGITYETLDHLGVSLAGA